MEHEDLFTGYEKVRKLVTDCLRRTVPPAELAHAVELEYGNYRQLCGPKHVNPVIQQCFGTRLVGEGVEIRTGPELHEGAERVTWFALESGVRVASIAVRAFAEAHFPERFEEIRAQLNTLTEQRRALAARAIARGWAVRAAPGGVSPQSG